MPTWDLAKSPFEKPTACSMARLAARSTPWVTAEDHFFCKDFVLGVFGIMKLHFLYSF
jgi:hypothetical protein